MKKAPGLEKVRDVHVGPSRDIASLIADMGRAGGFMSQNLWSVADTFAEMCGERDVMKFISFPADIMATGTRGILVDIVKEGLADAIITTCGTLDHDIARTRSDYYVGSFDMDDVRVRRSGFHRLGNVLVPVESYGPTIEKTVQPLLGRLHAEGVRSLTSERLCAELGRELKSDESLLHWAEKKGVPVFVPGITDGAVGSQIWLFAESHRDFGVDLIGDERRLSDLTSEAGQTGALVLGGGISKHHLIWWNQFRGGLDWACYVTTATEFDGSLSGAQVKEAISWGKVKASARKAGLYAEVTTVLPFIVSYALTKRRQR